MAKKTTSAPEIASGIEPDAFYTVQVTGRFDFERAKFGPNWKAEVSGEFLARLLASEHREKIAGFIKV